jgi:hypothetical protein
MMNGFPSKGSHSQRDRKKEKHERNDKHDGPKKHRISRLTSSMGVSAMRAEMYNICPTGKVKSPIPRTMVMTRPMLIGLNTQFYSKGVNDGRKDKQRECPIQKTLGDEEDRGDRNQSHGSARKSEPHPY